ncbi:MAG TPA: hypothetical protein VL154_09470 [Acetobacteraceae bacterium]|jgi:hypothetical protein|nr:hypothetical protein [Acetobacteraceae bacterium]
MSTGQAPIAGLNRLLVQALLALARAGAAEEACRIAARGWSLLRHHDAREAERLTAALHSLSNGVRLDLGNQGESRHG